MSESKDFLPTTVALYKNLKYGYTTIFNYRPDADHDEMVLISEPLEVQFKPLAKNEVIENAIRALDAEERNARMGLERALADIRERKSQLLSLTHQPEAA